MNATSPSKIIRILLLLVPGLLLPAIGEDAFNIYAPSRASGKLLIAKAEPNGGNLKLTKEQEIDLGFFGTSIVAHPDCPLLYVAAVRDSENENVELGALVTLDKDGNYLRHASLKLNHPAAYLSLDRTNRFLLGASYFDGHVDVYPLDENGTPGKSVTTIFGGHPFAHCVLPSPDNRFVYIPYVKEHNALHQYRFDPDKGTLTALEPKNAYPPEGTGPRHMAYHPKNPIVYFSNEQHLGVSVYEQDSAGTLTLRQVCDATEKDEPKDGVSSSDIAITPDGRFLFAGIRGHKRDFDWISRYRIKENGEVELLGLTPADKIPWGFALSPGGEYLLVSAFQGGTLTAFLIGENGSLEKAASLPCDLQVSDLVTR